MMDIDASPTRKTRAHVLPLRRRWPLVLACYLALCGAYFWPTFVYGLVPLPLMNPYTQGDPTWSGYAPSETAAGSNRLLGDITGFYYPYLEYNIAQFQRGEFPLWNPNLYGGIAFFATNQAAQLFPINLVGFWFGPHWYWTVTAVLRLLVAGGGMYVLARRFSVSGLGALLAGGVYMFAAFQVTWLHFAIHNVAALLPLALWLILFTAKSAKNAKDQAEKPLRFLRLAPVALAGTIAAQMFGGHPEMSLFFMVVCGLFALFFALPHRHTAHTDTNKQTLSVLCVSVVKNLAPFVLACALGLALSAVQWVPTLGLIRTSYTLEEREFAVANRDVGTEYSPLGGLQRAAFGNVRHWLLLVVPELWGYPPGDRINYWLDRTNYNEMASYVGLTTLPLVVLGAWRGANRRAAQFFGALFVISLLLLYPLPGLRLLGFVPPFSIAYGFRFGLGVTLGAAVLAGLGLDVLRTAERRTRTFTMGTLLALAALNAAVAYDLWNGERVQWALGMMPNDTTRTMIAAVWNTANWRTLLPGVAGALAAGVLALTARGVATQRNGLLLIVAIALAEITAHGYSYNGFIAPEHIYPRTAAIERLTNDDKQRTTDDQTIQNPKSKIQNPMFRVLNLDGSLWANSAMTHGVQVTGGLDDLTPGDQGRFVKRGMAGVVKVGDKHVLMAWGQRLIELMNVRYVTSRLPVTRYGSDEVLPLEIHDRDLRVHRNERTLPRAYAATSIVPSTQRDAENTVFDAAFDPLRAVVLEEAPVGLAPGAPALVQPVPITSYTPDRVELAPDLAAPAVVILADAYTPDWRVTVDGQDAKLLRANALFRGVVVPAGQHRVVFTYRPRLVEWSALVGSATLLVCVAWIAMYTMQSFAQKRAHQAIKRLRLLHARQMGCRQRGTLSTRDALGE